jgi:membrane-bound lytic murein transglycosylase A
MAGWFNHYGRVWVLKAAPGAGQPVFSSAQNSSSQGSLLVSQ